MNLLWLSHDDTKKTRQKSCILENSSAKSKIKGKTTKPQYQIIQLRKKMELIYLIFESFFYCHQKVSAGGKKKPVGNEK